MAGETEPVVVCQRVQLPVVLPDGTKALPLGSGYISTLIGTGGMSNVYKIWNPQMETYRAVKLMKPDLSAESCQRFQTEIKIMAALSHPNIIKIHSVGEWNGLAYIEMEFVDGFTLAEIIAQKGALPLPACSALAVMMARALAYAHSVEYVLFGKTYRGIIHRDLKPSNIMIAKNGGVKLMDFGIARPVETSLLTMDGAVMGTMQYLAPEQVHGKNVGIAADIYALGVVLYECLTGKKAFPQENLSQLMAAKTENNFVPLRFFKIKIPANLKKFSGRCMAYDANKRAPAAAIALKELEHIHAQMTRDGVDDVIRSFMLSPIAEKTVLSVRRPLKVPVFAWGVIALLAFGAITSFLFYPKKQPAPPPVLPISVAAVPAAPPALKPAPPVPKTVRQPDVTASATLSYLDKMKAKLGVADPLEVLAKEAGAGNFASALHVFNDLPPALAGENAAQLLRLRSLYGLGKTADAAERLNGQPIDDGEFYLTKAKYLCERGETEASLALLEKSLGVPAQFLDGETLRREYHYYRAICLTRIFDQAPSDENRKSALDSWFEVKNSLRNFPDHSYYRKAVAEMQKIGDRDVRGRG
jgi:serine/threonine protein kinase